MLKIFIGVNDLEQREGNLGGSSQVAFKLIGHNCTHLWSKMLPFMKHSAYNVARLNQAN
jgi:hypothetical protein